MLEDWWREISAVVAATAVGVTVKKYMFGPSKIDRELCALQKTIDGMHSETGEKLDTIAEFMHRVDAHAQLMDERYELTNSRIERLEKRV